MASALGMAFPVVGFFRGWQFSHIPSQSTLEFVAGQPGVFRPSGGRRTEEAHVWHQLDLDSTVAPLAALTGLAEA